MDNLLYDYHLPDDLIGKNPPKIRHNSRLLIYNTKSDELFFDVFLNIFKYLPKNSSLVFNDTRVIPARVFLNKETGGKLEAFFLVNEWDGNTDFVPVLFDRKMVKGEKILFDGREIGAVSFQKEKIFFIKFNGNKENLFGFLNENGKTPIPKYIKNSELSETDLRERYQTIFASNPSSVAAPTASLHFTDRVFESLDRIGIEKIFVTLSVGLGTFAPISKENFEKNKLHVENFFIPQNSLLKIENARKTSRKIGAVGTTVVRVLETFGKTNLTEGQTEIFIHPPFNFAVTDFLITNFHLPNSSLMMLVEAFLQNKKSKRSLKDLYDIAISEKMKFYSFGDAMLII